MNTAAAIAHLESRYGTLEELGVFSQDVEDWIPTALERTKEWAVENGHKADLERVDTVTLDADGAATIPDDMLSGRITGVNHASSVYDFADAGSRGRLALVFADLFGHYAIEDGKVWMKGPVGSTDPLEGDGLIGGIFQPTLGTLPDKLVPHFLDELVELAAERKKINPIGPNQEGKAA